MQIAFDTVETLRDGTPNPTFGNATQYNLLMAPAERADVIIDFSKVKPGSVMILYSDAPAPFPGGDPRNDYFTGDPNYARADRNPDGLAGGAPTTKVGSGPNTRTLMQIRIAARNGAADPAVPLPMLPPMDPPPLLTAGDVPAWVSKPHLATHPPDGVDIVRDLTLNEYFDEFGRLIQLLGHDRADGDGHRQFPPLRRGVLQPHHAPVRCVPVAEERARWRSGASSTPPATRTRCTSTW